MSELEKEKETEGQTKRKRNSLYMTAARPI